MFRQISCKWPSSSVHTVISIVNENKSSNAVHVIRKQTASMQRIFTKMMAKPVNKFEAMIIF